MAADVTRRREARDTAEVNRRCKVVKELRILLDSEGGVDAYGGLGGADVTFELVRIDLHDRLWEGVVLAGTVQVS